MLEVGFGYGFSKKWCFVVHDLMAVNCSTRIKKKWKITFLLPGSPSSCFSLEFVSSPSFSPIISSPVSYRIFCLLSVSPCLLPWVVLCCAVNLVFLPTVAFVFYHKFMWLTSRLRQAERGRQSAELDNRLFKQDFGDKINSLQLEVEELTRQRWREGAATDRVVVGNSKAGLREKGVSWPSHLHSVSAVPFLWH